MKGKAYPRVGLLELAWSATVSIVMGWQGGSSPLPRHPQRGLAGQDRKVQSMVARQSPLPSPYRGVV